MPEPIIGQEIRKLSHLLSRNFDSVCREHNIDGVTAMHAVIVNYLKDNLHSDIFQRDIEVNFEITRSTVTNILQLMEKKGYILRQSIESDARLKKLTLTESGLELANKMDNIIKCCEEITTAGLTQSDIDTLLSLLNRIGSNL